jgi:hypothetical protein
MKPTWAASLKWQNPWQAAYPPTVPGSRRGEWGSAEFKERMEDRPAAALSSSKKDEIDATSGSRHGTGSKKGKL